mmetsp:Transcript_142195/g.261938  ORF Transcript_142195/g.261938 Transcript_142195/m.261938 type:complete len:516 (-) Transcript_142195:108-1655(-)
MHRVPWSTFLVFAVVTVDNWLLCESQGCCCEGNCAGSCRTNANEYYCSTCQCALGFVNAPSKVTKVHRRRRISCGSSYCSVSDCCEEADTCSTCMDTMGGAYVAKVHRRRRVICNSPSCTHKECCERAATCTDDCPSGQVGITHRRRRAYCASTSCNTTECCETTSTTTTQTTTTMTTTTFTKFATTTITILATNATISLPSASSSDESSNALTVVVAAAISGLFVILFCGLGIYWLLKRNAQAKAPPASCDLERAHSISSPEVPLVIMKPSWWGSWPPLGQSKRTVANAAVQHAVQMLISETWSDVVTRDRKGGGVPHRLEVVNVLHNENRALWESYAHARAKILEQCVASNVKPLGVKTSFADCKALGDLDRRANEFLLFHGTRPSSADKICSGDFRIDLAGSGAGSMYGNGVYFAERSSKGDEYAGDDEEGVYQGLYAMLLCRVTCGNMLYCDDVRPSAAWLTQQCTSDGACYHSVLGDREKARGTYREFIIYDKDQAYPEYVIIYRRVEAR